ncbi:MAG: DUF2269 family protein [Actinomycetota bacterium]|nr:DUF2269 family protein [Actinomycetota bacterium]
MAVAVLHAVTAVAAFAAMAMSGVYGATARRLRRPGAAEEVRRFFAKPSSADGAVLAVAPLGVTALLLDPHGAGLGQLWVWAAIVAWVVASLVWFAVVRPAGKAIAQAAGRGDGEPTGPRAVAILRAQGRRLAYAGAITDVVFVVALGLMVFQPG